MVEQAASVKVRPSLRWVYEAPSRFIAFGFGTGVLYPGPGTWGTLLGWLLWVVLWQHLPDLGVVLLLVFSFALGCWACQRTGDDLGVPDHGGMNWDEVVAFWLVLWLSPAGFWAQLCAFALFRFFDIVKPPPVRYADQRFSGGFGVMFDDIVAALYALLVMAVLVRLGAFI
ncbi:phosphatidylglycerophosphatase A [Paenalcaligenes niemegkensis]|uniref:phosphatidylglycerophosphatase A family protein n=1 Tax=Paenalcaligenes niemegkensis TaxID=2895469 RepID=UPI001EE94D1C|nr:phosphatidylglycerophosphatase A [Paenalcaligenes niemegkensis]MCQ9615338.1 phosphatidylglycerophosphatase A [Paenalcaligenes niemegkensis]